MQTEQDLIFDVTTAGFPEQVLIRSSKVPVVVDFWAAWCAPCRALGPVLEKAIADRGGAVVLAKVDTEQEAGLAKHYRISGIPAVKAFRGGQVVDEFTGARDARFVGAFLDRLVPTVQEQQMDQALRLLNRGDAIGAEAVLRPLVDSAAASREQADVVRIALCEALLAQGPARYPEVGPLLDAIDPRTRQEERVEALRQRLAFFQAGADLGQAAARDRLASDPKDPEARYALASVLAERGAYGEALEELLTLVSRNRRHRDDGARQAMLLLFGMLGPDHDLSQEYRRRLQVVL